LEQLLTIELFGQPYTFKTDSDLTEAKEVANVLVQEVQRVESAQKNSRTGITKHAMLVLAALNIANENLALKRQQTELMDNISQRAEQIIRSMEKDII